MGKWKKYAKSNLILLISLTIVLSACRKEYLDPISRYEYLESFKKAGNMSKAYIRLTYNLQNKFPEIQQLSQTVKYNVDIYNITYWSRYGNSKILVSGVICVPAAAGVFPLLSFQNGTNTLHSNAPTENSSNSYYSLIQSMASNGYIILMPDYIGFGTSVNKVHPYYQSETSNRVITDMIYAAREFLDKYSGSATYSNDCYLMGYSQGGWATLSALKEIELNHGNEINLIAASCGGGAYDLIGVTSEILNMETFPGPLYLPYYIYSHQEYGSISDSLGIFFLEPYASAIPGLFNGSFSNREINSNLTDTIANLLTPDLCKNFSASKKYSELRKDLANNSVDIWDSNVLIRFYHGDYDMNVPVNQSRNIYKNFLSLGKNESVSYIELEGLNHETAVLPWGIGTILWFNQIKG